MSERRTGWGVGMFLLGFVCALVLLVAGGYLYLRYGNVPVATADPSFPDEVQIVHIPLNARIARDLQTAPFPASEAGMQTGAQIYKRSCANCHGIPGQDTAYARFMYPTAPQLWAKHGDGVVGVSDDPAGVTYWKVDNGIRLTGMPAFQNLLSKEQMWQVSLLLKDADQPMSPAVMAILMAPGTTPLVPARN